ncbi:hypothetical protein EYF80_022683 [Liparis tanakae]|uniref:Uncharacterized protein n=1 Tax=Liparis tanakae TaxID=230148 RepID=A0A4Z2HQ74_9TELE|nr:hypothetical protein EYF80_022683 [Liparis tanakae]
MQAAARKSSSRRDAAQSITIPPDSSVPLLLRVLNLTSRLLGPARSEVAAAAPCSARLRRTSRLGPCRRE